ncbi:hypothetical protein C7374_104179 [Falsochrobactrum ovis]|uniref:Uncharacterized protein n=1 Tax=Falsochrobactrum ovis TaxID=1293442 RepID=A0A364JW43_9HYPH|nr:hypothetical protein C7374_104179 [Falsochrobactrum ovis]
MHTASRASQMRQRCAPIAEPTGLELKSTSRTNSKPRRARQGRTEDMHGFDAMTAHRFAELQMMARQI